MAHFEYVRQRADSAEVEQRVVMVVQPTERNQLDQRMLEYELWERHSVRVERLTLAELASNAEADSTGALVVTSPGSGDRFEVSVA